MGWETLCSKSFPNRTRMGPSAQILRTTRMAMAKTVEIHHFPHWMTILEYPPKFGGWFMYFPPIHKYLYIIITHSHIRKYIQHTSVRHKNNHLTVIPNALWGFCMFLPRFLGYWFRAHMDDAWTVTHALKFRSSLIELWEAWSYPLVN